MLSTAFEEVANVETEAYLLSRVMPDEDSADVFGEDGIARMPNDIRRA